MAEVTRVPLKPISRQSLLMLVLGILIGLAIAGGIAWYLAPKGVSVHTVKAGAGDHPKADDVVFVHYVGKLANGTEFDRSQDPQLPIKGVFPEGTPMQLSNMIPGFREALIKMQKGGKYEVVIPADKAYGATPPPGSPIPANADLHFEVEVLDFMPMAEAERRYRVLQQMMAAQAPKPEAGAPGAAPAPTPAPAPAPAQ
jgi:FKBP-type peptidyl-prolyl cis-trans isomerase FkpA